MTELPKIGINFR